MMYLLKHFFIVNSGRYSDFAKQLNANGYKVYAMDWIGKFKTTLTCLPDIVNGFNKPKLFLCAYLRMFISTLF